jgi:hypothetical protein
MWIDQSQPGLSNSGPGFWRHRAFDGRQAMIDAEAREGAEAAELFERLLANPQTSYLQRHNAKRGCYDARVERA